MLRLLVMLASIANTAGGLVLIGTLRSGDRPAENLGPQPP